MKFALAVLLFARALHASAQVVARNDNAAYSTVSHEPPFKLMLNSEDKTLDQQTLQFCGPKGSTWSSLCVGHQTPGEKEEYGSSALRFNTSTENQAGGDGTVWGIIIPEDEPNLALASPGQIPLQFAQDVWFLERNKATRFKFGKDGVMSMEWIDPHIDMDISKRIRVEDQFYVCTGSYPPQKLLVAGLGAPRRDEICTRVTVKRIPL